MKIAFSILACAVVVSSFVVGCGGSSSSGDGQGQEDTPSTTAAELRAGCRWERLPGPCPVAQPGGGALNACWPALYGDAHWERICKSPVCPAGEVWTGSGCTPDM